MNHKQRQHRLPFWILIGLMLVGCAGQPISDIVIITQPPYTERLPKRFEFLRRWARAAHSTTQDEVIRRYLLMRPGQPCNQIRRAEHGERRWARQQGQKHEHDADMPHCHLRR